MAKLDRVTQLDVALAAGVDVSTVSLALRNSSRISASTRDQIQQLAKKMGYQPDPMLSALSFYRTSLRDTGFQGALAYLTDSINMEWKDLPHYREYYLGAHERAAELGYQLEHFSLRSKGMTESRMATILRSRGVRGVLVAPQFVSHEHLSFPWEHFSAVAFGYTMEEPQLHRVTSAHFYSTSLIMKRLITSGFRRIGFSFSPGHDKRIEHNFLAAYYMELKMAGIESLPLHDETGPLEDLKRWIKRNRIEAIISSNYGGLERFLEMGIPIPEKLSVLCPCLGISGDSTSGIYEGCHYVGQVALNYLVSMMHRGELGIPKTPERLLVEGKWNEGRSYKPLHPAN